MTDSAVTLPAVVLAGAPAEPELKARFSVAYRAEVPVAGKMMVQYVVDALNASRHVRTIYIVGDIQCEGASQIIPSVGSFMENLAAGMKACGSAASEDRVLVATADIPMVTSAAIDDFIGRCGDLEADFYYPIIAKELCEQRFPGMKRTYARLGEGTFTGGNVTVMNARFLIENAALIDEILEARKSVIRVARLIGFGILVRAAIAQVLWAKAVNLALLERTAGRILNADVKAVQIPYAEIGVDVDDIEQLEVVEKLLMRDE